MLSRLRAYRSFWVICVAAIVVDIATKLLVVRHIPFGTYFSQDLSRPPIMLFDWFWIVHVGNKGAAWGWAPSMTFARS